MKESFDIIQRSTDISFVDFCNLDSIRYWRQQLSGANVKNIKNESQLGGTKNTYTYGLLKFHNWLLNREFQYVKTIQMNANTVQQCKTSVNLDGVEHLLELSKDCSNKSDFAHLIKEYLAEILSTRKRSVVKISMYSIRSFFQQNESDISFEFKHRIRRNDKKPQEQSLSLEELWRILTVSNIQPIEKAVFLCKFQRGLDSATLADRFNFEVLECLIKHFGSDDPESWDLKDSPVPVPLVRVKTGFPHMGFLDVDAVHAIVEYLKTRHDSPKCNHALFVDTKENPITVNWIYRRFRKLVARTDKHYLPKNHMKGKCVPHEMRDLLKSTLIDSGCRSDVADHIIGHSPKDSYEKQMTLYPESVIREFSKASGRINLFTGTKHYLCEVHSTMPDKAPYEESNRISSIEKSIKSIQEQIKQYEERLLQMERRIW